MIVRKLRLQRGWSQEQLATMSGLSVRTVQRIERGQTPGLESLKALASVFEVELSQLQGNSDMNDTTQPQDNTTLGVTREEKEAMVYVQNLKGFYGHLLSYVVVISALFVINLMSDPDYIWAKWPMLGWGIGLALHGVRLFKLPTLLGPEWERRQIEKRLGRKL